MDGELFYVEGRTAFVISPKATAFGDETPWVWYAPTLPDYPSEEEKWMFEKFHEAGIAVAGIDVGESYGSPQGRDLFLAFYRELVSKRGFSKKACLLARSRGALMLYNWATENPLSVACVAGIYPVCDLQSYPGLATACTAYGMTAEQLSAHLSEHNPIDRLEKLAAARVPLFHIHGDNDTLVPLQENSGELLRRYRQFGGEATLLAPRGQGHDLWSGFFQCQELVDFVIAHV